MAEQRSAVHARLTDIEVGGGELLIGDIAVSRLAERAGGTPFYAYDRNLISRRIEALRAALPPSVKLHYAIKANPMPAVVGHLRSLVDGFDIASLGEMMVALDSGMSPAEVSFAGPAKQLHELRAAIAAGVCLNCESETELARIHMLSNELGLRARVALRVNPDFELKGAGMKMTGAPKQFGIDAERVPRILRESRFDTVDFVGLHIFCGSQTLKADAIIEANERALELALRLGEDAPQRFHFVNLGGGYGIPYFPGELPLDLRAVGDALGTLLARNADAIGATEIIVELGRYIVGEAGYYVTRISDLKLSQGQLFAMVDGGLHHHLSNSGNFGQVLRKNYPVLIGNRVGEPTTVTAQVVGPLCTPLDIVADRLPVPDLRVGDYVVVLQSGAYGFTASPHLFLGHPPPREILV